jgi:hypothetical protein
MIWGGATTQGGEARRGEGVSAAVLARTVGPSGTAVERGSEPGQGTLPQEMGRCWANRAYWGELERKDKKMNSWAGWVDSKYESGP